ncbi:MAG: hypothetical protein R2726_23565 [Acidimicrobiales bacterium]
MPIRLNQISRVVIGGEWITVDRGTFEVEPMQFVDEGENPTTPPMEQWAYHFFTDNRDEYFGPIEAIQLFKMANL